MSSKYLLASVLVGFVLLLFGALAAERIGLFEKPPAARQPEPDPKPVELPKRTLAQGEVERGGVFRNQRDVEPGKPIDLPDYGDNALGKRVGSAPPVAPDANPHTRSVAEALKEPAKFPERLSSMHAAKEFDKAAFESDPETYLTTVEPGRIWQAKSPGEDVSPLKRRGGGYYQVIQGESVQLQVEAEPGAPVTFHSFKLGQFDNLLTTMTVRADEEGIASVNFTATKGTFGELDLIAASPLTSGQARFVVNVNLPAVVSN